MTLPDPTGSNPAPAIRRLQAIAGLDPEMVLWLKRAAERSIRLPARRELLTEGKKTSGPMLVLEGWAARVRIISDGRRQIIGFVLPGDFVGNCGYEGASAASTVAALTGVTVCQMPQDASPQMERVYAISRALDEAYLMAQIVRLGRLDAAERIVDLLLELQERLAFAGLAPGGRFDFPLTQELFADALGLTSVHVNRMVQQARRRGELSWIGRNVHLIDIDQSRRAVGRQSPKVV